MTHILLLSAFYCTILTAQTESNKIDFKENPNFGYLKTWNQDSTNSITGQIIHKPLKTNIDPSQLFSWNWNTNKPYSYPVDLSHLKDSLLLNLQPEGHERFHLPHKGFITSRFKKKSLTNKTTHLGYDIIVNTGDSIYSVFDGKVRFIGFNETDGNVIIIRHQNGLETSYSHLSKVTSHINQEVKAGDVVGLGGNTGRSTGSHLHFETRIFDTAFDPSLIINFKENKLKDKVFVIKNTIFETNSTKN